MSNLSVSSLLDQIQSSDSASRLLAIKRLGMIYNDDSIIDPLLALLLDKEPKIREAAILSLSTQSHATKIIKPIINTLTDEDTSVQLAAIKALSEFRSILATKPLVKILSDPSDDVRAAAVLALGLIEDKNALFPLIDALEDNSIPVKLNALAALAQLGDPRGIDPIVEIIENEKDIGVRQMAILSLGPLGQLDIRIIPPLVKLLDSPDPRLRQCTIVSLGRTKSPEIVEPLIKVINDEDPFVRRACATALSEIKDPITVNEFIDRLKDTNEDIRETAARALGKLGDKKAVPGLIPILKDSNPKVREEAAIALGELMDSTATKSLLSAFKKEKILSVRIACIHSVGKTEGHAQSTLSFLPASLAIRPLIKALSDKEIEIRSEAAESLAKIYLNLKKYRKAKSYFNRAASEALSWDFRRSFYIASGIGCGIIDLMNKKLYQDYNKEFTTIYDNLDSAAKMLGNQAFISKNYWKVLEVYNQFFQSKNKGQFVQSFRDLGLKILILAKKLPKGKEDILNDPQDRLNEKFQMIDKRNLNLTQSLVAIEALKDDLFEIGNQILQIEPLELQLEEDKEATINVIEELTVVPSMMQFAQTKSTSLLLREEEILIHRHVTTTDSKKFSIEEVTFDVSPTLFAGQEVSIGLVQFMKGSNRKSLIEPERELIERHVKRYYNYEIFHESRVLQFTKESIQMRAKPKIIGYLDDSIYDGHKLIIFPESSMPESYLPKLQEFANRFNIFIIAGVEAIVQKGHYYNRAYIVCPLADQFLYQQKNSQTIFPSSEKYRTDWVENVEVTSPPVFKLFNSPFGRFIILIGQDIKKYCQYMPYITREKQLDFIILLNNGIETENSYQFYQELADDIDKPVLYVNTGQFGGTGVYHPGNGESLDNVAYDPLQTECSEGLAEWSITIQEVPDK